jgi:Zn-dependent protease/CBS domain-containing protein
VWRDGAIRVARVGGIVIDIHFSFGLVLFWGAWEGWSRYSNYSGALYGLLAVALLFACILLHELGHALLARALGINASRITLLPVGGLAQFESSPAYAWQELIIVLTGPLVNLILALVLGVSIYFLQPPLSLADWPSYLFSLYPPTLTGLALYLVGANIALFLFNMLPAFPMDGGRTLRASLALVLDYEMATRLAAGLGCALAILMIVLGLAGWPSVGLMPNPFLLIVAVVVVMGAYQEERHVRRQRALVRTEVGSICQLPSQVIAPWDTVSPPLVRRLFKRERALPVMVGDRLVGLLTHAGAQKGARRRQPVTVAHLMRSDFPILQPHDTLWVALQEMDNSQLYYLPVVDNGIFLGLVSLDHIEDAWRPVSRRRDTAGLVSGGTSQ